MDMRRTTATIAGNVVSAMAAQGVSPETLASATHIDLPALRERLESIEEFSVAELVNVGGFLHVPTESLLEGVAA